MIGTNELGGAEFWRSRVLAEQSSGGAEFWRSRVLAEASFSAGLWQDASATKSLTIIAELNVDAVQYPPKAMWKEKAIKKADKRSQN